MNADLDPLPPAGEPRKPARQGRPKPPNDEDLPAALPDAATAKPRKEPVPKATTEDDEVPDLDPPKPN